MTAYTDNLTETKTSVGAPWSSPSTDSSSTPAIMFIVWNEGTRGDGTRRGAGDTTGVLRPPVPPVPPHSSAKGSRNRGTLPNASPAWLAGKERVPRVRGASLCLPCLRNGTPMDMTEAGVKKMRRCPVPQGQGATGDRGQERTRRPAST